MKTRYRLIHRGRGHGTFYSVDSKTGKRTSLGKATKEEARQIVDAKNQAERQPMLNLQLAKAYLAGTDAEMPKRTWQHASMCHRDQAGREYDAKRATTRRSCCGRR
jgi:hypothetical protein